MNSILKIWKDTKYTGSFNLGKKTFNWHFNLSLWLKVLVALIAFGTFFVGALDFQAAVDGIGSPVKYNVSKQIGTMIAGGDIKNLTFFDAATGGAIIDIAKTVPANGTHVWIQSGALTGEYIVHVVDGKIADLKTPNFAAAVDGWHQYVAIDGALIIVGIALSLTFSTLLAVNFGMVGFVEKKYGAKMASYAVIAVLVLTVASLAGMIIGAIAYSDGKEVITAGDGIWQIVKK